MKLEPTINLIAVVIAGVALFSSFRSCAISKESNGIAREAATQIYDSVRPQLSITMEKREGSDNYLETIDRGNALDLAFAFEIVNTGNATARQIGHPELSIQRYDNKGSASLQTPVLPRVLGIGEKKTIHACFTINGVSPAEKDEIRKQIATNYTSVEFSLRYSHELDETIEYRSTYRCAVKLSESQELASDIEKL